MPKHHYVPQFYLKRFGNGKYISAILMDHDFRFVEKASIRDQSCKPDYYAFSEVEHICSQLEGEASRLMQVVDQATQLTPNQITSLKQSLKQYFVFQIVRTPAYVQAFENAMSVAVSSMYAMSTGHEGFNNSKPLATVKNAKMWAWKQMAQLTDTLSDLNMTLSPPVIVSLPATNQDPLQPVGPEGRARRPRLWVSRSHALPTHKQPDNNHVI